ncbi:MAG: tetratricopeptide repeat protein [Thermogemmata sp.]|nr:tetratricopeptide repeat protein [Thermogemmata sp.]
MGRISVFLIVWYVATIAVLTGWINNLGPSHAGDTAVRTGHLVHNPKQLRQLLQRGNYAEAEEGYRQAAQQRGAIEDYLGWCRVLRETGRYDDALKVLDEGLKKHKNQADLLAERAEVLYVTGRWEQAHQDVAAALRTDANHFRARWVQACLLRDQGDLEAADQQVRWLVRTYTQLSGTAQEIRDAERLLIVGLAGAENARRHRRPQQFAFILNEIYKDALRDDPDCWQAEYQAAQLLLEKHNRAEGEAALDKALAINPRAADALALKGRVALDQRQAGQAVRLADKALKIHPNHLEALRLLADVRLLTGDLAGAENLIKLARDIHPRAEATWARQAVLAYLKGSAASVQKVEQEVLSFCRTPGLWHLETAELLLLFKRYPEAEHHYKQAVKLRPDLPAATAGLGFLYWQLGREEEAQQVLKEAFQADPFHVRVANALKVLEHLSKYQKRETDHFVIKFSERDKVLAAWLADYLELWYAEYQQRYGFTPAGKVLVEILASREMFSGRILALPDLPGTVQGASTGPLLLLPSPRADNRVRLYNWVSVARHELTHVFNLQQTHYRVPTWLTEGLAVHAEQDQRFLAYQELLKERLVAGTIYNLNTIARGYQNFAHSEDVITAYYQGWLYVQYLTEQYGQKAIRELLEAYQQGLSTQQAILKVCGVSLDQLEQGYRRYLDKHLRAVPPREILPPLEELEASWNKHPDNAEVGAQLAAAYLQRQRWDDARRIAEKVWRQHQGHPATALVLARLHHRNKDVVAAAVLLEETLQRNPGNVRLLRALARYLVLCERNERAIAVLEQLRSLQVAGEEQLEVLAELYALGQQRQQQAAVLADLAARQPDNVDVRRRLARLWQQMGNWEQVARWAESILWIDVEDSEAKELLLSAWQHLGMHDQIRRLSARYR